jgi:hypothetical protein
MQIVTSGGILPVVGRLSVDKSRPVILCISGISPPEWDMVWLPPVMPDADVLITHLPEMAGRVAMNERRVRAWHQPFREMAEMLFSGRRLIILGCSTGCLVALGIADLADDLILAEPFLRPAETPGLHWVYNYLLQDETTRRAGNEAFVRDYFRDVVGIGEGGVPDDFSDLLSCGPAGFTSSPATRVRAICRPALSAWKTGRCGLPAGMCM